MSPSETVEKGHPIDTNLNESAVRQDASAVPSPKGGPRHYHLLWDEELEALRPVLRLVLEHLEEVIAYWYQLYVLHFGDRRSLSEPDFREIFYNALSRNTKDLLEGDMDRYSINTIRTANYCASAGHGKWVRPGPSATGEFQGCKLPASFSRGPRSRTHRRIRFQLARSRSNRSFLIN